MNRQLKLEPITRASRNTKPELFRRRGSQYWQARFVIAGQIHRRTTGTPNEKTAWTIAKLWHRQITRRGKPTTTACLLDR